MLEGETTILKVRQNFERNISCRKLYFTEKPLHLKKKKKRINKDYYMMLKIRKISSIERHERILRKKRRIP